MIFQKFKMGDIRIGVSNTLYPTKKCNQGYGYVSKLYHMFSLPDPNTTEGAVPAKNCQGFQVLPPSMDFSRAQTPGRGESAIVTTTYATCAHPKIYIS
jgi:hypothetical protein